MARYLILPLLAIIAVLAVSVARRRGVEAKAGLTSVIDRSPVTNALEAIQVFLADDHVPGQQFVLRHPGLIVGVGVADGVERGLGVVVGDAEEEGAAEARVLRAGGEQGAGLLQRPLVGAVRFLVDDGLFERAAVADNGEGIHGDPYFRHRRDVRQGV